MTDTKAPSRAIPIRKTSRDASVTRALSLLEAFRDESGSLGVSELARRTGLAKSTTHRLLGLLARAEFLSRAEHGYRMGLKVFELGNLAAFCEPGGLRDVALPFLSELFVLGGKCSVTLSVLSGGELICVEKIRGHGSPNTDTRPGYRLPKTMASPGKAILAFSALETVLTVLRGGLGRNTRYSIVDTDDFMRELRATRERGYAVDRQESLLGLMGVAAPLLRNGLAYASIAVSAPTMTFDVEKTAALVTRVAADLNSALDERGAIPELQGLASVG